MTLQPGHRTLAIAAVLVLAAVAALGAWAVAYPYQTSYVEGYMLEQGQRMAQGGGFYQSLDEEPYIVDNFPPLYPAMLALGVGAFGTSFAFGRALTLVAVAGLAAVAWRFHRSHAPPAEALAWIALWAVSPYVLRRALLLRMDFFALLLVALGLGVYLHLRDRTRWAPLAAVPLLAAAILTRQTMLAAPAAVVIGAWMHGRRRDALVLAGGLAAAGVVAIVAMQAWEPGFLRHTVLYNTGRYHLDDALRAVGAMLGLHTGLVVLGALGAATVFRDGLRGRVLAIWWLLAALTVWTVGKPGSTYNHFLELLFVSLLLAPVGLRAVLGQVQGAPEFLRNAPPAVRRVPLAVGLLALLFLQVAVTAASAPLHSAVGGLSDHDDDAALVAALEAIEGPVLSENAGAAVQAGHGLVIETRTLLELHLAGAWDQQAFVASLRDQNYTALVLERADGGTGPEGFRFSDEAWAAVEANYAPVEDLGQYRIWRPA